MKIKNIIFTAGLLDGDDYAMENIKGWRGDILVEDFDGNYFELTFIDTERLISEVKEKKFSYEDWGWVVVEKLNVNVIVETIVELSKKEYFKTQKPQKNIEKNTTWTKLSLIDS